MNSSITSPAAQVIISIIPIVGICMGTAVAIIAITFKHHEIKSMIAKGEFTREKINFKAFSLLFGLLLLGVGLVMTALFALLDHLTPALLGGLIPFAVGAAFLIFYKAYPGFKDDNSDEKGAEEK